MDNEQYDDQTQADPVNEPPEEKMVPQSKVNEIVKSRMQAAQEKARREAMEQMQQQQQQPQEQASSVGGQSVNPDEIYQQIYDRFQQDMQKQQQEQQKAQQRQQMEQVANTYFSKMQQGNELYDDFDNVTAQFDPGAFPQVVYLASQLDNTPAVIYELSNNPSKLANLDYLAQRSPQTALNEMKKLEQSVQANLQAKQNEQQNAAMPPLSQMEPSSKAGADTGEYSVQDFKNLPWLKG